MKTPTSIRRADLYSRVTERVIADLEKGVRPWLKPWRAGNGAGRVGLPRRHNGVPYRGINVLVLWGEALDKGYGSTIWMTFKQALAVGGHVRRTEHGAVIVYADRIIRTETDECGQDVEREIPFLKAYSVFNVAQIDGLPAHYYASTNQKADKLELIEAADASSPPRPPSSAMAATGPTTRLGPMSSSSPYRRRSATPKATPRRRRTSSLTGPLIRSASHVVSAASASATWATPARSWWPSSVLRSFARTSESPLSRARTTRRTWATG